ncbi:MAG: patatin-like phospholipase family protein [Halioglobus sp.]
MGSYLRLGLLISLISGCASHGVVNNTSSNGVDQANSYSIESFFRDWRQSENALMLAFSGGGTRASALSYGVMKELRDTPISLSGDKARLLDDIHVISSVSGGSFTSAYYGLHGDRIFDDFESAFLRKNVQGDLLRGLLNPLRWLSGRGRTEMAVQEYEETVFGNATYADMRRDNAPLILINSTDLSTGVRFSFVQEYFNLLCSDLSTFPVARAVTASSAVPIVFEPVVVKNYPDCGSAGPRWEKNLSSAALRDPDIALLDQGLRQYFDRQTIQYSHFVDGGITDNLGLRAIHEIVEVNGGINKMLLNGKRELVPKRIVIISVDASVDKTRDMALTDEYPKISDTISAVSSVQLNRYNVATIELIQRSLKKWAQALSTPQAPVSAYFIRLNFSSVKDPQQRAFFNTVPTSFDLSDEQVDRLIEAGGELLRENPEYRRLLTDLKKDDS